uniref:J domain-containing protein n=1 Tax=Zooxanthella nutricula TaxID=1333877 RepID=A0A7S2M1Z1_9DINO
MAAAAVQPHVCQNCNASSETFAFFCRSCGAVMDADYGIATHFDVLGLEPRYALDLDGVDKAYKDLQKQLHPDRHAQAGERDKAAVEAHAARLNEAVATLRSPLRRAGYWMELHGVRILEDDQRMQDAEMMMEVMEVSEQIEDASTQVEIDELVRHNNEKIAGVEASVAELFSREDWAAARPLVEKLQMLTRLGERMNEWTPS